jgi:hypothetical protein
LQKAHDRKVQCIQFQKKWWPEVYLRVSKKFTLEDKCSNTTSKDASHPQGVAAVSTLCSLGINATVGTLDAAVKAVTAATPQTEQKALSS